ncbi:MAG: hypothetical protein L0Y72_16365 [Gemmataceae bacterium]|nr:hypothetical protein [Gemmataceae bacterium]MCI0740623.1 hypothetical protein [Gemmataceae bacterium]
MKVITDNSIKNDQLLKARVRRACQILEEVVGSKSDSVTADWSVADDGTGFRLVYATITDSSGNRAETHFQPNELANEDLIYAKFYKKWGDLLQQQSHKLLDLLMDKN